MNVIVLNGGGGGQNERKLSQSDLTMSIVRSSPNLATLEQQIY
jgi:hypothetical protein